MLDYTVLLALVPQMACNSVASSAASLYPGHCCNRVQNSNLQFRYKPNEPEHQGVGYLWCSSILNASYLGIVWVR